MHWMTRWWKYRAVHRMFGFKFWAIVVGAAPLDPELEAFWGRLGFVVVQGYGLTETAPIVTLNHPFHATKGAVGKPIAGVEIKIADDGEILVRGENVTRGYFNAPEETRVAFRDGWFHTGDVGEIDEHGTAAHQRPQEGDDRHAGGTERLSGRRGTGAERPARCPRIRGRRRLDRRLHGRARPRGAGDRAGRRRRRDRARAPTSSSAIIRRCACAAVWPGNELPRTEGTQETQTPRAASPGSPASMTASCRPAPSERRTVASVLERFAPGRTLTAETTLDALGLSSLERVELMMALEEAFQVTVDEARFSAARTIGDLEALTRPLSVDAGAAGPATVAHD